MGSASCAVRSAPVGQSRSGTSVPGARDATPPGAEGPVGTSTAARYRVYSARLTLEVESDDQRESISRDAEKIATSLDGYVADSGTDGFVLRVPAARLDRALDRVAGLGEVLDRRVWAEEVTEQYVDLTVRRDNLRRLQARLQALLDRATTVTDILPIEKELGRVTEELERMEGRLRVLSDRVRLATIDVDYQDAVRPGPIGWVFYGLYEAVKWLFVWD